LKSPRLYLPPPPRRRARQARHDRGLSGGNANTGEAVFRNLLWAVERVNQRGGVKLPGAARPLQLERYDSKGQIEEALSALRSAIDDGARSSCRAIRRPVAAALIDASTSTTSASRSARAVPQLLGRRPGPDQREVQLLALPLRRPRRHAHGGADVGAARTTRRAKSST
jgi:hypothetical protein